MKRTVFLIGIILTFIVEAFLCGFFYYEIDTVRQDAVVVNDCLKSVETNYGNESAYSRRMDYAVLDSDGKVVFKTSDGISESINAAVKNNDTILDLKLGDDNGKIIIHNETTREILKYKNRMLISVLALSFIQLVFVGAYYLYLRKNIIEPFGKLNDFAERLAGGNMDVPLEMDRKHAFGSFTEAFDIMRHEIKTARAAEKKANDDKKEMVAKLSHDIKTPVASIKSTSEIGYELAKEERIKNYFNLINEKSDQITVLVDNLFNSSVSDITEIAVSPKNYDSSILSSLIRNSDHLGRATVPLIPECRIYVDKLRLQQAFDNVFMNSYKYADTKINVEAYTYKEYLVVKVSDEGPGVTEDEIYLIKEKYKRGQNSTGKEGAGLGLYLTEYFIDNMDGRLEIRNEDPGLSVLFYLRTI